MFHTSGPCLPFFHSVFPHYAASEIGAHSLFQRYQPANATGQHREIGLRDARAAAASSEWSHRSTARHSSE